MKTENDDDSYAKSDSNRSLRISGEYNTSDDASTSYSSSGVSSTESETNDARQHSQQCLSNITEQSEEITLIEENIPTLNLPGIWNIDQMVK